MLVAVCEIVRSVDELEELSVADLNRGSVPDPDVRRAGHDDQRDAMFLKDALQLTDYLRVP